MQGIEPLNYLQVIYARLDRRTTAVLLGLAIGILGGALGIAVTMMNPVLVAGGVFGGVVGLYIITNIQAALYAIVLVMMLLPFGTLPFDIGFTPTLLDAAIGGFLLVYLVEWMTRQRTDLRLTPPHLMVLIYLGWLLMALALGLRHSPLTLNVIRQFAGTVLALGLVFAVVDLLRDRQILRRLVVVVLIGAAAQSVLAIGLWLLPDTTADLILSRLGRFGYPVGGTIQYIESNPALGERAIGTFIAPNSLGGMLAIAAVIIAPQVFARKPVLRYRWLTFTVLVLIGVALVITFSRASALALAFGLGVIAIVRYRRYIPFLILLGLLLLLLPQAQFYLDRFIQAFTAQDLATQMRIGEWTDSLRLIRQYPIFGVGFTGSPDIELYTDVANMYLIMANQIGLVGVAIFLATMLAVLIYGLIAWQHARRDEELDSIHLGYHAALVTALVNAVADLYFFRLDFQPLITV
ncbi:MAG: O-antigen ligase family protein, partial [Phototrophicaceae bacterium]